MLRVGLTGGLASGKSLIAKEFAKLGAYVIEADALGHDVLIPSGEAFAPVVQEFGEAVVNADGTIDRKKLSAIVFDDPARLKALTAIVHPAVAKLSKAKFEVRELADPGGILVYEAAILIETGSFRDFDKLIVAACPEEVQIQRAIARDGLSREAVEARLSRQLPLSEKLRHADFVIDTGGTVEQTIEQTRNVFEELSRSRITKK